MIARIWHGWTTAEDADAYENLLRAEVFPGIRAKQIPGFERIELFRRSFEPANEVEFMTVMWFTGLDAVKAFAGEEYEASVVPHAASVLLTRFDHRSRHYEVREQQNA
jgi:heme-degrading monooxygenase HmoA